MIVLLFIKGNTVNLTVCLKTSKRISLAERVSSDFSQWHLGEGCAKSRVSVCSVVHAAARIINISLLDNINGVTMEISYFMFTTAAFLKLQGLALSLVRQ